jgi:hypothetical protein
MKGPFEAAVQEEAYLPLLLRNGCSGERRRKSSGLSGQVASGEEERKVAHLSFAKIQNAFEMNSMRTGL